jgi:hypothetical protein
MKQSLIIKEVPFGIACRIGRVIYIHKDLKDFSSDLYEAILQHEIEHTSGFTTKDVLMDLDNRQLKGLKKIYYRFVLSHPSSLIEVLPAWKYDGKIVWNILLTVLWVILIGGAWLIALFLR